MANEQFQVVYRVGGTADFKWLRCLPVASFPEAEDQVERLHRAGYKSYLGTPAYWAEHGLPDKYEPDFYPRVHERIIFKSMAT